MNLTNDQRQALKKLQDFLDGDAKVFTLQGYAGSGKTTLLKGVIEYLNQTKKPFDVMAPTGRAAKILRDKTGYGQTIHKTIYNFEELITIENKDNGDDYSFHYVFPIRQNTTDGKIMIIDEASMVSSREAKSELFTFGTDNVLNDLLTYAKLPHSANKIIFVGDPAQLPPVGDNSSNALAPDYFERLGLKTYRASLQEIVRQNENAILKNATKIRSLIAFEKRRELSLEYDQACFVKISSADIASQYAERFPAPAIGQGVIIAFSNVQCFEYNRAVREKIFPQYDAVTSQDLLIVNHNNYNTYGVELMNGESVQVLHADEHIIVRKNIPIYETINGKRVKKHITLNFRKLTISAEHHPTAISCLIIDSLLHSPHSDLTLAEMKALYVDFVMRFQDEQEIRKQKGLTAYKTGSLEFKEQLKKDPFYNALRVKYGYAITCHKAQGGEWQTAFIDYFGRTSLKEDPLRWAYTATTRAVERCYAANAPSVSVFSRFTIGEIQQLTTIPHDALALNHINISPYHTENQHRAKSLKYWEVSHKIEKSPFQIFSVKTLGPYHERYSISFEGELGEFDTHHNEAGIFNEFHAVHTNQFPWQIEVLEILNHPYQLTYNIDYSPKLPVLERLYGLMQSICAEEDVAITNIVEKAKDYYVVYFLKTDAKCASLQFYFNGKDQLTRAMPKSTSNTLDAKLNLLISKLQAYVI